MSDSNAESFKKISKEFATVERLKLIERNYGQYKSVHLCDVRWLLDEVYRLRDELILRETEIVRLRTSKCNQGR